MVAIPDEKTLRLGVRTRRRSELVEITRDVADLVRDSRHRSGHVLVYVPHTTAGVTINENADPDVASDMLAFLDRLVPRDGDFRHAEGNSDAHIKASMMGSSVRVIIEQGRLRLGRWQGIYLAEFDGPRQREVWLSIEPSADAVGGKDGKAP